MPLSPAGRLFSIPEFIMPDGDSSSHFGPWAPGLDAGERKARLWGMRAFAQGITGNPDHALCRALRDAEDGDAESLERALIELDRLPALTRRRLLKHYDSLIRPSRMTPKRRKPEG